MGEDQQDSETSPVNSVDRYNARSVTFGILTGLYAVAATYLFIGFSLQTREDIFRVFCLFVVGGVGGVFAYNRDPKKAWSLISFFLPIKK